MESSAFPIHKLFVAVNATLSRATARSIPSRMMSYRFIAAFLLCSFLMSANAGRFGRKSKQGIENDDDPPGGANDDEPGNNSPRVDQSDDELMEVMEQFSLMSEEEREEAFAEVIDLLSDEDDPELVAAIKEVMDTVKSMDESSSMVLDSADKVIEDQIAEATGIALEMISNSDWELIYNKRGEILESLMSTSKFSAEDAALYKSDDDAWEKELHSIWDGLQNQANDFKTKDEL